MPLIRPFTGLRPDPRYAGEIIAPPYDVLSSEEARLFALHKPNSFLHVSKPEIDLPPDVPFNDPAVYRRGAQNFRAMIERGLLRQDSAPHYYIYRLEAADGHRQTGLVATVAVADYLAQRVRRHEHTKPDKEDDRVQHMEALGAQTGPVLLTHRDQAGVAQQLRELCSDAPAYDALALEGVKHSLWPVADRSAVRALTDLYVEMDCFYIADGHHRSAAAARVAQARGAAADQSAAWFLAVLFPAREMRILDYNRVVRDLNGATAEQFVRGLGKRFTVTVESDPVRPRADGEFGMYLDGHWHRLVLKDELRQAAAGPVGQLDVALLSVHILEPLLNITDPRRDPRIDFVGGVRGLKALQNRVDSGEMAAAFSMYPTPLQALMDVADAGGVMPPKSTWFEPKLADGMVSHMID